MYVTKNFKTKKALKEAIAASEKHGVYAPGLGTPKSEGWETVEGPWYPEPHKWYAQVFMQSGIITKVK